MPSRYAVYIDDDVYLFGSREEAEEYAKTKRRDGVPNVRVEAEAGPDGDAER